MIGKRRKVHHQQENFQTVDYSVAVACAVVVVVVHWEALPNRAVWQGKLLNPFTDG